MHHQSFLVDTYILEYDLIPYKLLLCHTLRYMDLDIYFECKLCSLDNQNCLYILDDSHHMDFHDNLEYIHKRHDRFQHDILHYYRMVMGSIRRVELVVLVQLKENIHLINNFFSQIKFVSMHNIFIAFAFELKFIINYYSN